MARTRRTLEEWIREALTDGDKEAACSVLCLIHKLGAHDREIHAKKIVAGVSPSELAALFRGKAETYAQDLSGVQTFNLLAFYGKNEPEAFFPFLVQGDVNTSGNATEPPTPAGEKAQGMRFAEQMVQMAYRQMNTVFEMQSRLITQMASREERLLRENHEAFEIVRDTVMRQVTESREHEIRQLEYTRQTEERRKWLSFAPPLINTILGREVFPQATVDTTIVEAVAENLTEEQIQQLAIALPAHLWGPLAERMSTFLEKKRSAQEAMARLVPGNIEHEFGK